MPASSIPVVAFVVAMFGAFMVALGWVSISQALADRRDARLARAAAAAATTAPEAATFLKAA